MKFSIFILLVFLFFKCSEDIEKTSHTIFSPDTTGTTDTTSTTDTTDTPPPSSAEPEFRTILHSRGFIFEQVNKTLLIFQHLEELNTFFDTTHTLTSYINFNLFNDSTLIGMVYPSEVSLSAAFSIESLLIDSSANTIFVKSHLYDPIGKMTAKSFQSHFIAIPKTDFTIIADEITVIHETTTGTILPFYNFLQSSDGGFSISSQAPKLIVLKNKQDQNQFLDTIPYFSQFPDFEYNDSMLVGIIAQQFNHVTLFEIVSAIEIDNKIKIAGQFVWGVLPALSRPFHFVSMQKSVIPIEIDTLTGISSIIDDP